MPDKNTKQQYVRYSLPFENWLRFMLAHDSATDINIRDSIELFDLWGTPTDKYLNTLRQRTGQPPAHGQRRWYRKRKLLNMFRNSTDVQEARAVLGNSRVRFALELLLLARCEYDLIPDYMKDICGHNIRVEAAKAFKHYFWNVDLLSQEQWYHYLRDTEHPSRYVFIDSHQNGVEFALWKAGHREDINKAEIAKVASHEAIMRFFETSRKPNNRDTALTASLWAETYVKFTDQLQEQGGGLSDVLDQLKQLAIRLDSKPVLSIDHLKNQEQALPKE